MSVHGIVWYWHGWLQRLHRYQQWIEVYRMSSVCCNVESTLWIPLSGRYVNNSTFMCSLHHIPCSMLQDLLAADSVPAVPYQKALVMAFNLLTLILSLYRIICLAIQLSSELLIVI